MVIPFDDLWSEYKRIIKTNGVIVLFGQDKFTAKCMLSNEKWHRYNLIWKKVLVTGFLNANRMPLREHEDIIVFYKKLPTYNPQKYKGVECHSRGKAINKSATSSFSNEVYGEYKCLETKGDMKFPTSIIEVKKLHPSITKHPNQKPIDLLEWLIKTYSNEGDTVLDNCMGSGSTCLAARNLNRQFIGIEKEKKYFDIAVNRIMGEVE